MVDQIDRAIQAPRQLFSLRQVLSGVRSSRVKYFEWGVCLFMAGIAIYFALPFEPDWRIYVGLLVIAFFAVKLSDDDGPYRTALISICLVLMGLGRSAWHTSAIKAPILPEYERTYTVEGWIKDIEKSGGRNRWVISVKEIDQVDPQSRPKNIRVRINSDGFAAGDFVQVKARLSAPPGPVMPGGYNSARAAYYKQIGAYGYAIAKPLDIPPYGLSRMQQFERLITKYRFGLADRIMTNAPERVAGLQVALLTGIRIYIPESQTEALRMCGLAHVLAISGLHMGLVTGSLYYVFTLLLACIVPVSRHFDVRKIAAIIGIISATAYLMLSGASVATQRAYIMAVIVFMAVILNRKAFSLRSVALAAVVTLALRPEALVSAGFQMSFAAVTALVVVYRYWDDHRQTNYPMGLLSKFAYGFSSLTVTSLVAGAATGFFAAFHFKRIASFGLLGNILAMPIFTFWVMPMGLIVYFSMIFGWEAMPLKFMGWGLEAILWIAGYVANLPGAVSYLHQGSSFVMGLFVLGFLGLCLGPKIVRLFGVVILAISYIVWYANPLPDMRISETGAIALRASPDRFFVEPKRSDRFGREIFAQNFGEPFAEFESLDIYGNADCDTFGCFVEFNGASISILNSPEELPDACSNSDIVVLTGRAAGANIQRTCTANLFDADRLKQTGAMSVYMSKDQIKVKTSNRDARRPWRQAGY